MTDDELVRIEITLPRPFAEVWPAFRDPELIRRWHGWEYDEGGGLDAEIRQIYIDGTIAAQDERTLHIGGHLFAFEDAGAQTIVRVTRAAPVGPSDMDWDAWYDDIDEGWLSFLQQLRFALAHQWGNERDTLYLSGEAIADRSGPVAAAFGLNGLAGLEPGQRYEAAAAGEHLTGELWCRSDLQLGLTVDAWGPGLLLLAEAPNPPRPHGAASATLTTYDGEDRRRSERWRSHWAASYGAGG